MTETHTVESEQTVQTQEYAPPRATVIVATGVSLMAALALFPVVGFGSIAVLVGAGVLYFGIRYGRASIVTTGTTVQLVGASVAAVGPVAPTQVAVSVGAVLFAWDAGQHAVDLGHRIGGLNVRISGELIRLGITAGGFIILVLGVSLVYLLARGQYPATALSALVITTVALLLVLWLDR